MYRSHIYVSAKQGHTPGYLNVINEVKAKILGF